jgi:hypothetical protein
LVDDTDNAAIAPKLKGYTGHRYRLRWWFPEDYKQWSWVDFGHRLISPNYWSVVAQWLIDRRPFGPTQAVYFYYYVKNGVVSPF